MSEKEQFVFIFSGVWCGLGLILLIISIGILSARNKNLKRCTAKAVGIVKDIILKSGANARYASWHPVIEFTTYNGMMVEIIYSFGSNRHNYSKGQEINILYDPENPERILLPDDKNIKLVQIVFMLVGIGLIVIGALVGILVWCFWQ